MAKENKRNNNDRNNNEHSSKRKKKNIERYGNTKTENLNHLFPNEENNRSEVLINVFQPLSTRHPNDSSSCTTSQSEETEIALIISKMSENIKFLTEKINNMSAEILSLRNNSVLKIDDEKVTEEEKHLLNKFQSFDLPVDDQSRLEELELYLKNDQTFKIFFVSINKGCFHI